MTDETPTYVRDTRGELAEFTRGLWRVLDALPVGSTSTGLRNGAWELWGSTRPTRDPCSCATPTPG
jgi:hypothetical protein